MEVDEIHTQACKLSRIGIGRNESNKIGKEPGEQYKDEDEEDGKINGGEGVGGESGRLRAWHSSRIFRVSRASGGKDRHSKVLTAKGLRDRRVRLSVSTAIQFYDLQDRLGYDQPSKAVEWLIKAASDSIAELPPLRTVFPDTPKQPSNEKRPRVSGPGFDPAEIELDPEPHYQTPQQQISLSKSAGSSTSETSKGSGLSLSRSEIRVKARERARERTAKEKESPVSHEHNVNPNSQNSSFTELLTGGNVDGNCHSPTGSAHQNPNGGLNFVHKPFPCPMDYYGANLLGHSWLRSHHSGFSGQTHFGNALPPQSMTAPAPFSVTGDHQPELQQFSFMPDHLIPVAAPAGSDYNHNFTISSSLAGFNRGTLQSNSQSPLPHLQRFSPFDGQNLPFFLGTAASGAAPVENHQFPAGFDSRLQLYYGDECRHSDLKGKGKN